MSEQKTLVLVDGSSYLFRAFHALPPLMNSKGVPTGAVYGVLNMLKRLVADYQPDYFAVIFDPKGKTFRHNMYEAYKANRAVMPDDLRVQIGPLHEAIRAQGMPLVIVDGVEADDVIGTMAMQAKQQGLHTVISTGDKDMAQLVNEHITLVNTMSNKILDRTAVIEKFGVPPELIIDYLALMGDTSDNIPGIPKVGPKTAAKWLNEYGSLDAIINNADGVKGKVGESLREHLKILPLSRDLATIHCDVTVPCKIDELLIEGADKSKLIELYKDLEFKRLLTEVSNSDDAHSDDQNDKKNYAIITDKKEFNQWLKKLNAADEFAFDTETTSLNSIDAQLVGVSFAVAPNEAAYVPVAHDYLGAPSQLDRMWVLEQLTPLLQDKNKTIVGHNLKYDIQVLKNYNVDILAQIADTLLESYVLNSSLGRHGMDSLALKYLGETTIKFEDVAGKGAKQLTFNQIDLETAGPYAAEDADITLRLHQKLRPMIDEDPCFSRVLDEIEMPLMPVLADVEYTGVLIDADMLHQQSRALKTRIVDIEKEVFSQAGEEFNLASPKQLQEILYDKLKLPILKKTPTGKPSTAENVLQELAMDYPLPKFILEFRSLSKLKSTYTDALPEQINAKTGRVHTSYNQAVTATGRLSSTKPNLQNIPIRSEQGRKIRQAFIAPKGFKLLAADYSQVELRIMAHLSNDPGLVKAFEKGWDVHASTAAEVYGISLEEVSTEQRRRAKAVNFGLMYGMSAFGLAQQLGITRQEAQEHIDIYFSKYPAVLDYMEQARETATDKGYVETLFGRRLFVPDIHASNMMRRKGAERAAINAPLQGTAADIIKRAMISIDEWLCEGELDVRMIMQVHDELVFEVPDNQIEAATQKIKSRMENAAELSVPLIVDIGVGDNWDEAH